MIALISSNWSSLRSRDESTPYLIFNDAFRASWEIPRRRAERYILHACLPLCFSSPICLLSPPLLSTTIVSILLSLADAFALSLSFRQALPFPNPSPYPSLTLQQVVHIAGKRPFSSKDRLRLGERWTFSKARHIEKG